MLPSILSAAKGVASGLSSFGIDVTPGFNITNKTAGIPFIEKNTQGVYTPANNVLGASTAAGANTGQTDLGFPTLGYRHRLRHDRASRECSYNPSSTRSRQS